MIAKNATRTLGLRIPSSSPGVKASFLANAEEMSDWIAALPLANIGETGRCVYSALLDFNRLELPPAERLKIAERLSQPLRYVLDNLEKHYLDTGLPLSPKGRKIAALGQELHAEMALPYKIAIEQTVAGRKPLGREALALAIHRAVQHLSQLLLQSALIYAPTPPHIWQELHRLYAFAAQNHLGDQTAATPQTASPPSIDTLYKCILLFTLANPNGMRQREILYLFRQLPEWSRHARLCPPRELEDPAEAFIVQLPTDRPPCHIQLQNQQPGENCLALDARALVARLREQAAQLPPIQKALTPGQNDHVLSQDFLRRLIHAWGGAPSRDAVRTPCTINLKVAVGIPALHALLKQAQDAHHKKLSRHELADIDWLQHQIALDQAFGGANHAFSAQPPQELVFSVNPADPGGEMKKGHTPAIVGTTLRADNPAPWADEKTRTAHAALSRKTLNESAGGYCISWVGADTSKVRVGELLGIQSAAEPRHYGIGTIRWLRETTGQELQLGVEMLTPGCQPGRLYRRDDTQHKDGKPCLLPAPAPAAGTSRSLISPTFLYDIGEELLLEDDEGELRIRLDDLLESTGAFAHFSFVPLDADAATAAKDTPQQAATDSRHHSGYDSVWDML